jgi:pyruvate dehydrogenase (quinone)
MTRLRSAIRGSAHSPRTVRDVLEAITDPNIFILPPQITFAPAKNYMSALAKGDPEEAGIIRSTTRSMLERLLPR